MSFHLSKCMIMSTNKDFNNGNQISYAEATCLVMYSVLCSIFIFSDPAWMIKFVFSWHHFKNNFRFCIPQNRWLLLLENRFSRVRLCATPETAAHQAPPSLGFSRQEHWSGLPFPSPMLENEKWKWSHSVVSNS